MIHARFSSSTPENPEQPVLHLSFVGTKTIQELYDLIQRSLNCAPEFGKDWFELSDGIEKILPRN